MSEAAPDPALARRRRLLRIGFLVLLAGGLIWMAQRRPRDLAIELDLSAALPGELRELDVVVRREGVPLVRIDRHFGAAGAPDLLRLSARGPPGAAELEVTLVGGRGARRARLAAALEEDHPVRVRVPPEAPPALTPAEAAPGGPPAPASPAP